jgi:hypothetical protein
MKLFAWFIFVDFTEKRAHLGLTTVAHGQPKTHKSAKE